MRKLLISLLLASAAAVPALAEPGDHHNPDNNRPEHSQTRPERAQRAESSDRQRGNGSGGGERQNFARTQGFQQNGQQIIQQQNPAQAQAFRAERQRMQAAESLNGNSGEDRRKLRRGRQGFNGRAQQVNDESLRQTDRPVPNVLRTRNRTEVVSEIPRRGTQPPLRVDNNHRRDRVNWNTNWRHDGRYDWHNWRNHHRSNFHLGFYYDPFGWGYQPYGIGWRLWPNYYSSNYWINDPWQYRLPFAPPGTQWIRYYNDALLVDTYTGEVVDVIRNFFW
jgi:Ni/Co efflux regulator RcnB